MSRFIKPLWIITEYGEVLDVSSTRRTLPGDLIVTDIIIEELQEEVNRQIYIRDYYNIHISHEDLNILNWLIDNWERFPTIHIYSGEAR